MCGNGIRSLMMFARQLGVVSDHCTCETKERRLELWHSNGRVTVDMGQVISYDWRASVGVDEQQYVGAWLNTGVPHVRVPSWDVAANYSRLIHLSSILFLYRRSIKFKWRA